MIVQKVSQNNTAFNGWLPAKKAGDIEKIAKYYTSANSAYPRHSSYFDELVGVFKWLDTETPHHNIWLKTEGYENSGFLGKLVAENKNNPADKIETDVYQHVTYGERTFVVDGFKRMKEMLIEKMKSMTPESAKGDEAAYKEFLEQKAKISEYTQAQEANVQNYVSKLSS